MTHRSLDVIVPTNIDDNRRHDYIVTKVQEKCAETGEHAIRVNARTGHYHAPGQQKWTATYEVGDPGVFII
ncbi:MAG: hypothetical protein WBD41_14030 [Rhodococcus sp. (in: high G+C Gram-positive bacteria)]